MKSCNISSFEELLDFMEQQGSTVHKVGIEIDLEELDKQEILLDEFMDFAIQQELEKIRRCKQ